ncbi:MAG: permease [Actinomycetota bacterium]
MIASITRQLLDALSFAGGMTWEILWALILGFALSAAVQAVVSKSEMTRLLPDDSPRTLAIACGLGAASSSCSYAAVALARSIFRKGADFTAAVAFEFASTNLVIELGIILWLLIGWQFVAAEFLGGILMVALLAMLFRVFLTPRILELAKRNAERHVRSYMQGHGEMDMSVTEGSILSRLTSSRGFTATSHYFVMDWAAIAIDIAGGLLIAGALAAWVPESFWQSFFLIDHPLLAKIWGPLIGPVVAMLSFVCSIGNVPLAAVLWNGGISFGGVASFIFADLIVLPILNIYRKYYGGRVSLFLLATFYAAMVVAGLVVEVLFQAVGLVPEGPRHAKVIEAAVHWNYTTVLNILFLAVAAILVVRFFRTNGMAMFRMMNEPMDDHAGHAGHAEHEGNAETGYVCPMHPEVRQDHPGRCPKCGMDLVEAATAEEHRH